MQKEKDSGVDYWVYSNGDIIWGIGVQHGEVPIRASAEISANKYLKDEKNVWNIVFDKSVAERILWHKNEVARIAQDAKAREVAEKKGK